MKVELFAEIAEQFRKHLVQLTMVRGHDYDTAEDIVQSSIINALSVAHRCKTATDVRNLLKTCTFRDSANAHRDRNVEAKNLVRLDDVSESELNGEAFAYDPSDDTDLKLDIKHALKDLTEDDRELVRFLFIEGWTYDQVYDLFNDLFSSRDALFQHVTLKIKPHLAAVLEAYKRPEPVPYKPLKISTPTFTTFEQVFHETGYEFKPVTATVKHHYDARQDAEVLERRFREDELESRHDWAHRESREPITAKLKHIGNRQRTRLFTVRKAA